MADEITDNRGVSEQIVADQVFSEEFDKAEGIGERAELSPADDPSKVPAGPEVIPPVVETPVVETPVVETPVVETPITAADEQQPGESDEKYEQRYRTLQGIHRKDKETWETERADLLTQIEEAKKPIPAPAVPEVKPEPVTLADLYDSLTPQEKAELEGYDAEFDVISKMEGKKREIEFNKLRKDLQVFKDEIITRVTPAETLVSETKVEREKINEETHFAAIREGHSDYETYRDDGSILKWIESKPKYMQKSMLETYSKGVAEDVVELITDFKKESNIPITQPSPDAANVVQMNPKKAERKQAMTAVVTRRGAVNASMNVANDFDGAFDEALNK